MKKICVVCFANYCRSPVAEQLLYERFQPKYEVISAGIKPMIAADMDARSRNFLNSLDLHSKLHNPRKINESIVRDCEYIFALDGIVLQLLNQKYRKYQKKIKLLNFQNPKIRLNDPFQLKDKDYETIMKNIFEVCSQLDI